MTPFITFYFSTFIILGFFISIFIAFAVSNNASLAVSMAKALVAFDAAVKSPLATAQAAPRMDIPALTLGEHPVQEIAITRMAITSVCLFFMYSTFLLVPFF